MLAGLAIAACSDDDDAESSRPFRTACETVVDQPFPLFDESGAAMISSLEIGGVATNNFGNRGHVIVQYADTDRIQIEMCRFTMASNQKAADEDIERLQIWAFDATGSPKPPGQMKAEDNCVDPSGKAAWQDGCKVRVYYDGQDQTGRSGADLRVTVPRDYIYDLEVTTEDNALDSDYQVRSNVCIDGLPGTAEVKLGSGSAYVVVSENAEAMPGCPDEQVATCEAEGWSTDGCPCFINGHTFSRTAISTHDASAADQTVDIPSDSFWAALSLNNEGQPPVGAYPACADPDDVLAEQCDACIDISAGNYRPSDAFADDQVRPPGRTEGSLNQPPNVDRRGVGYGISLTSKACQAVVGTPGPDDFFGVGRGNEQPINERGNLSVCSGCLREQSCEGLVGFP